MIGLSTCLQLTRSDAGIAHDGIAHGKDSLRRRTLCEYRGSTERGARDRDCPRPWRIRRGTARGAKPTPPVGLPAVAFFERELSCQSTNRPRRSTALPPPCRRRARHRRSFPDSAKL
jgi:hypothetical protein